MYVNKETLQPIFDDFYDALEDSEKEGYALLEYDPLPVLIRQQYVVVGDIREEDGKYIQSWVVAEPSEQEYLNMAQSKLTALLRQVTVQISAIEQRVATIKDAIEWGEEEEGWVEELPVRQAQLTAWKRYRLALNKVPLQEGWAMVIEWPEIPELYNNDVSRSSNT